ncbi:RHS repeat-associated protein [Peribacillus sp. B2I2]|uniref:DNRLRE domain-containing protein n=1 Tax=Peribacillus sp. B2I2 TaxID=3156468 RepID=UPI00351750DD
MNKKNGSLYKKILSFTIIVSLLFPLVPADVIAHGDMSPNSKTTGGKSKSTNKINEDRKFTEKVSEIKEKRKVDEKTFLNSNLSYSTEVYNGPVHYHDSKKEWNPIDNELETNDEADKKDFKFKNGRNKFSAKLSPTSKKKQIVSLKFGKEKLGFGLVNPNAANASTKDGKVIYKDVYQDTDIHYTMLPNGIKEDILLHSKESATSFKYSVHGTLTARKVDRYIEFLNKDNKVVWEMLPPFMEDAEGVYSEKIEYSVIQEGNKQYIQVEIDEAFVKDPARVFPIIVDPTVNIGGTASNTKDTYVMKKYPTINYYNSTDLRTGFTDSTGTTRSYIDFTNSLPNIGGGLFVSAELKGYKFSQPTASINTNVYTQRVTSSWASTGVTWNNQPTIDTTKSYGSTAVNGNNGWYNFNITDLVDQWYKGKVPNYGVVLKSSSEGTLGTYRKFYSSDYSSNQPYLSVTYSGVPNAPTGSAVGNGINSGTGYVNLNWTPVAGATGYKVLVFNGKEYEEINVGNVTSWSTKGKKIWPTAAQIAAGNYNLRLNGTGTELADDPRPVYKNSKGTYQDRKNYWFRIKAYNKYGDSAQSAQFTPTIADQTAPTKPGKPTITSHLDSNFKFTWAASTDSNSGLKGYQVYVGTAAGKTDVVNGTLVTQNSFTLPKAVARTTYHMYVRAVDNQGNYINSDSSSGIARKQLDASIVSYTIPPQMEASGDYNVAITVKNEGIETWTNSEGFMLGSTATNDPFSSNARLTLTNSESISTSKTKTFNVKLNGGKKTGDYSSQWQMLKLKTGMFGDQISQKVKVVDTTPPAGEIVINHGAKVTNTPNVTLTLASSDNSDSDISQRFRNEQANWTAYEKQVKTKPWTLSGGNGEKTVSVMFKDGSGNESKAYSEKILLDATLPTAKLTFPVTLDYLNGITEINGSATDNDDMDEYVLSYGKGESPQAWTEIAKKSDDIKDGILGKWDVTGMEAGLYTIQLNVRDKASNTSIATKKVWVDPLQSMLRIEDYWAYTSTETGYGESKTNLANGNLHLSYTDSSIKGRGLDATIIRSYNSQDDQQTSLGKGWRLDAHISLVEEPNGDIFLIDEDGSRHIFKKNVNSTYSSPQGVYRELVKTSGGNSTLTDLDEAGIIQTFNDKGQLISIEDKNGNKNSIQYDGNNIKEIVDSTGRRTTFTYTDKLLSAITDSTGATIKYIYVNQALTKVEYHDKDNKLFRSLNYEYDGMGKLKKYINPNKNATTYDYNGHRLISTERQFTSYNANANKKNDPSIVKEAFVYDLLKRTARVSTSGKYKITTSEYETNEKGNLIKTIDDLDGLKVTSRNVYDQNKIKDSFDGKGYKTSFTYDDRGNILTKTEPTTNDIEGNSTTPVTKYEYKPGTSLLTKEIDALGRVTSHEYDAKGNRLWTVDAEGFKDSFKYDKFGNLTDSSSERGPLYAAVPNFSFETGEGTSIPNWKSSGSPSYQTTEIRTGTRSVSITGSIESEHLPIKPGKLPVRALAWTKGSGAIVSAQFYDSSKELISTKSSVASNGSGWNLQHIGAVIPANASFITVKIQAGSSSINVDDVRLEESDFSTRTVYDSNGLHGIESYDPYGKKMAFEFDAAGNKIKETNELGQTARFSYNLDNQITEQVDRLGKITKYQYDGVGNLIKETDALGQAVEYEFDEQNHQIVVRNPKVTKAAYDFQKPHPPKIINSTEIDEYNELGEKIAEKDGNGYVNTYEYDSLGRLIKSIDPLANQLRMTYDANDNKVTEENFAWDTTTSTLYSKGKTHYRYDEQNRLTASSDPTKDQNTLVEQSKFDAVGNFVKSISGTGDWISYEYDKNDNAVYSKDSSSPAVETWTLYDGLGNEAIAFDKLGATHYIYEANGQLKDVVDTDGKYTTYSYNAAGDKTKLVDATGAVTEWEYDQEGQLQTEKKAVTETNPGESTKQVSSYEYDSIGQVKKKSLKEINGSKTTVSKEVTYEYDELSRLVKETGLNVEDGKVTENRFLHDHNSNVTHTWVYDESNPVPVAVDPDGDGFYNSETVSEYDANNRLISETITHTDTQTTTRYDEKDNKEILSNALGDTVITYDDNDRMTKILTPNFDSYHYEYLVDDSLSKVKAPGVETSISYNGGSKVKSLKAVSQKDQSVLFDLQYQHSDTEQITQISDKGKVKKKYTYTAKGQLETVEADGKKLKYSYDANSNLVKTENVTSGKVAATYTYTTDNRILQKKEYNETSGALLRTTDYVHNPVGMLAKVTIKEGANTTVTDYGYNSDDQLVKVNQTVNGKKKPTIAYEYDTDGNRIAKDVNDGTKNTHYHYHRDTNGELFLESIEGIKREDKIKYHRDADGNLLSFSFNDAVYYYQFNARGDVIALTDKAGSTKATYEYDEWGNVTAITGDNEIANVNIYRYVGKYGVMYDADANLYLMGWRDYDPSIGRFIVPDEYEGTEEDPTSLNRYLYADADPVNNIDPDGHAPKWLQKGWKATKKYSKKGYNAYIGNDIKKIKNPKSKWYQKAGATVSVASNFIPGAGQAKWAAKGAISAVKYGKKAKKVKKFKAAPLKKERKQKSKPKPLKLNLQFFSKSSGTHRQLTSMKVKDSHHIIQDAAVRAIPGYHRNNAPAIHLQGPNKKGTKHYKASKVQRQSGGAHMLQKEELDIKQ